MRVGCYTCHGTVGQGGAGARLAPNTMPLAAMQVWVRGGDAGLVDRARHARVPDDRALGQRARGRAGVSREPTAAAEAGRHRAAQAVEASCRSPIRSRFSGSASGTGAEFSRGRSPVLRRTGARAAASRSSEPSESPSPCDWAHCSAASTSARPVPRLRAAPSTTSPISSARSAVCSEVRCSTCIHPSSRSPPWSATSDEMARVG